MIDFAGARGTRLCMIDFEEEEEEEEGGCTSSRG